MAVLPDRVPELRFVDLDQRGAVLGEQAHRVGRILAEAPMAEFHRERVVLEGAEQPFEIAARRWLVAEARGELREQRAELAGARERIDRGAELVDVRAI